MLFEGVTETSQQYKKWKPIINNYLNTVTSKLNNFTSLSDIDHHVRIFTEISRNLIIYNKALDVLIDIYFIYESDYLYDLVKVLLKILVTKDVQSESSQKLLLLLDSMLLIVTN